MNINYIYDLKGKPEYAVIPIYLWNKISNLIEIDKDKNMSSKSFEPKEFRGILSNLNIDTDQELSKMRDEWERK